MNSGTTHLIIETIYAALVTRKMDRVLHSSYYTPHHGNHVQWLHRTAKLGPLGKLRTQACAQTHTRARAYPVARFFIKLEASIPFAEIFIFFA